MSVLDALVDRARARANQLPPFGAEPRLESGRASFRAAIRGKQQLSVVAEFKRMSPSLGSIAESARVDSQALRYERSGAAAISVLTEPTRFGGDSGDLVTAAEVVALPLLMKDFVVDPRQIEHGARLGASAVLLIARCLDQRQLEELVAAATACSVDVLIECHEAAELDCALAFESAVIGVNNRDLDSLQIDIGRAVELLKRVPRERIVVAESGYRSAADVATIRGLADAALIGSSLMKSNDPEALIAEFMG